MSENLESWSRFTQEVSSSFEMIKEGRYLIYSDRDKGLLLAVNKYLNNNIHYNCSFHLYNN